MSIRNFDNKKVFENLNMSILFVIEKFQFSNLFCNETDNLKFWVDPIYGEDIL